MSAVVYSQFVDDGSGSDDLELTPVDPFVDVIRLADNIRDLTAATTSSEFTTGQATTTKSAVHHVQSTKALGALDVVPSGGEQSEEGSGEVTDAVVDSPTAAQAQTTVVPMAAVETVTNHSAEGTANSSREHRQRHLTHGMKIGPCFLFEIYCFDNAS